MLVILVVMAQPAGVGPVEAIYRTIRVADDAVRVCHEELVVTHPARQAIDDVIVRLHDARRALKGRIA